jgi:hypothetical protein
MKEKVKKKAKDKRLVEIMSLFYYLEDSPSPLASYEYFESLPIEEQKKILEDIHWVISVEAEENKTYFIEHLKRIGYDI